MCYSRSINIDNHIFQGARKESLLESGKMSYKGVGALCKRAEVGIASQSLQCVR
jgi:hypothetical protein